MIRFNCPHCGRPSEVPDALARLPLVCKQCGQRVVPAEAPKAEAPPPQPVAKPQAAPEAPPAKSQAALATPAEPEINLDLLPPPAPKPVPKPAPAPEPAAPPEARPEATLLPFVADLATFVLLVVIGMLLGEQLAGKATGVVLSEAGSAAKFPPVDLLLWGAPPVAFGLVYILLGSRERTVGAWLRRRKAVG